jgi:hypothetical protein
MFICNVAQCRFPSSHTTKGHRCGTCGSFGHGQIECGHPSRITRLNRCIEVLPQEMQCSVVGCTTPWYHCSTSHHCSKCGKLTQQPCCTPSITRSCPMCKEMSTVDRTLRIFTSADCVVCFEKKPVCLFSSCGHAVVCHDCLVQLQS